jgi:hypothetical protein
MAEFEQVLLTSILFVAGVSLVLHLVLAVFVHSAATKVGAYRGRFGGGLLDMGPGAWFFVVLVFGVPAAWMWAVVRPAHATLRRVERMEVVASMNESRRYGGGLS